jgi:RHS repeat-associated protein
VAAVLTLALLPLRLRYARSAATPLRLAAVDRKLADESWASDVGAYLVNADGGVTARTRDGATTTLWRNAEGSAQVVTNHASAKTATYHYDPSGERSEKLVTGAWGTVHEARYTVDASFEVDTLHDTHEVHVFVGSRRIATSTRTGLGHGVESGAVTEVRFYHPDPVGTNSISSVLSASGHSVARAWLEPFGEKQAGSDPDPRHLFTDQERDAETGLDYFGARYYDPWVGRFLEQDPELLGSTAGSTFERIAGESQYINPHAYVLNRPMQLVDPDGRDELAPVS